MLLPCYLCLLQTLGLVINLTSTVKYKINVKLLRLEHMIIIMLKPDAPQGTALYDRRCRTLNSWCKYGHNIQA